jgi:indole-3-glycerol phosphate synthase
VGFLSEVVEEVRRGLERRPLDESALMGRALASPPPRDFEAALRSGSPAVIAELKRASPSSGAIADRDAGEQARAYEAAGAAAVSVLTEPRHFGGALADLRAVRMAVSLPVLRKDFVVHPSQLIQSRAEGADAVLLISAAMSGNELAALVEGAADLDLAALVETHSEEDLEKALAAGARIVGVNARDLESLEVDGEGALRLLGNVPSDRTTVLESGISTREDVMRAVEAGASAVLVGEALMRANDPAAKLRELLGVGDGS